MFYSWRFETLIIIWSKTLFSCSGNFCSCDMSRHFVPHVLSNWTHAHTNTRTKASPPIKTNTTALKKQQATMTALWTRKVAPTTPPRYITNAEKYAIEAFLLQPHLHSSSQPTHTQTHTQNINTPTLPHGQIHLHTLTPTQIGCHRQTRRLLINRMKWNAAVRFYLIFQRIVRIICYICILSKHLNNQKYNLNTNKHQPN